MAMLWGYLMAIWKRKAPLVTKSEAKCYQDLLQRTHAGESEGSVRQSIGFFESVRLLCAEYAAYTIVPATRSIKVF